MFPSAIRALFGPTTEWARFFASSERPYGVLSAFMGEIGAARSAGVTAAKKPQMASAPAARLTANGSQLETP